MSKGRKWASIVVAFSCMITVTGCLQQKQLEQLALVTAAGYDLERENVIRGTVAVHQFDPMQQNITRMISTVANTSKGLLQEQNLESNQKLVTGQLRCVIYSKELAEKGIFQLVDALNRDSTVGNMVFLTIAEGSAKEILKIDRSSTKISLGTYLYNLIKQNVENEQILSPTLHEFNHKYYDIGKDPVLPILKIKDKDVIISGMALFKDDQYIAKLETERHFYLKILSDKYNAGTHEFGFKRSEFDEIRNKGEEHSVRNVYNKLYIDVDNIRSHAKIKLMDKKNLKFKVEVELASRLLESTEPLDLSKPGAIKFIEKKLNTAMEKEMKQMVVYFQELDIDPVGFGNKYITHIRGKGFTKKEWRKLYKQATFDVEVKNKIIKTGVID
ncbi:Ger(x)C family spore germination protein [Neobacillus sp. MM2021_6]|uniref:Ger(x)C family spore germination protein n=1 Tax=Bacillaceae TaxID=186817 RepID=UPI00140D17F3|nr:MULTISPECIES: Ger(x)C family spore germination protein [Bacillaceae]MBO0958288.1 Ger(x)C family spore germination protein [Neobacillus sp. MM2021_6]NHC17888.1 Ger(x)C family spore germination protein [Bacillus sp. MM2020_4]